MSVAQGWWRPHARSTVVRRCPAPDFGVGCAGGSALGGACRWLPGMPLQRQVKVPLDPEYWPIEAPWTCAYETATCEEGHEGVFCSTCAEEYYKASAEQSTA